MYYLSAQALATSFKEALTPKDEDYMSVYLKAYLVALRELTSYEVLDVLKRDKVSKACAQLAYEAASNYCEMARAGR